MRQPPTRSWIGCGPICRGGDRPAQGWRMQSGAVHAAAGATGRIRTTRPLERAEEADHVHLVGQRGAGSALRRLREAADPHRRRATGALPDHLAVEAAHHSVTVDLHVDFGWQQNCLRPSMRVNRPQCARVPYSAESLVRVEASWYGRTLRAIPEVLSQVGYQQADHGESLLTSHHCCLGAAEGARPGWVGSSAGALSGLLDSWAEASTAHAARIGDHSYGMHLAAVGFAEMEEHNAAALAAVYPTGGGSARCDGVDVS